MFKGMSKFQIIFTGIFAGFLVLGVAMFALNKAGSSAASTPITVWGFLDANAFTNILEKTKLINDKATPVTYVQKDPATFEQDFVDAIVNGTSPDVVMITQEQFYKDKNKLFAIPYANLDQRTFKSIYLEEAELFMTPDGIYAIPFVMDPYVMYWNRSIFQNAGIAEPPTQWSQFYDLAKTLTTKDGALNITRSAAGLGEYTNITHGKELLSTLIMQAGSPITEVNSGTGVVTAVLDKRFDNPITPAEAAVNFYTQFSDPAKDTYTWNRSLPSSKDMFISGDLATYFGPASELFEIQAKNPNLDFDVTYMPQTTGSETKLTFGNLEGLAIVKTSKHIAGAYSVIMKLTSPDALSLVSQLTSLPPVRRDQLAAKPTTAYGSVFYNSALYAKGWIDPDSAASDKIFGSLIDSITAGRAQPTEAVTNAANQLELLFNANATPSPAAPSTVPSGSF